MSKFPGFPEPSIDADILSHLTFREVSSDDPHDVVVFAAADTVVETVMADVQRTLAINTWWIQPYWCRKGRPIEQFKIGMQNADLTVYVYGESLSEGQVNELSEALSFIASLGDGLLLKSVRHLVFDDVEYTNWQDGSCLNGHHDHSEQMITIFPHGRLLVPHRVKAVSNLAGTVAHEFAHSFSVAFENQWAQEFGWQYCPERRLSGGRVTCEVVQVPERCVTEYATMSRSDDVAESLVAAIWAPTTLDPNRLDYLRRTLGRSHRSLISIERCSGQQVELPLLPRVVRYHRKKPLVVVR